MNIMCLFSRPSRLEKGLQPASQNVKVNMPQTGIQLHCTIPQQHLAVKISWKKQQNNKNNRTTISAADVQTPPTRSAYRPTARTTAGNGAGVQHRQKTSPSTAIHHLSMQSQTLGKRAGRYSTGPWQKPIKLRAIVRLQILVQRIVLPCWNFRAAGAKGTGVVGR